MIERQEAERIADRFVESLARPAEGYRFSRSDPVEVEQGWYFDYLILCELNIPEEDKEQFGGAPGFVIDTVIGEVSQVSHGQWVDLGLENRGDSGRE
jgi:hypothetical protein